MKKVSVIVITALISVAITAIILSRIYPPDHSSDKSEIKRLQERNANLVHYITQSKNARDSLKSVIDSLQNQVYIQDDIINKIKQAKNEIFDSINSLDADGHLKLWSKYTDQ